MHHLVNDCPHEIATIANGEQLFSRHSVMLSHLGRASGTRKKVSNEGSHYCHYYYYYYNIAFIITDRYVESERTLTGRLISILVP